MLSMILLLKLYLMMKLCNEVDHVYWPWGWITRCLNHLCGPMVGWRTLIQYFITFLAFDVFNISFILHV
jgi:hypothetical protein